MILFRFLLYRRSSVLRMMDIAVLVQARMFSSLKSPKHLKMPMEISQGGNAYPYEVTPSQGMADPSWRYILINSYGGSPSIVMVPRGSKISEHLPELFLNYGEIKSVPQEFYRCIVSTCTLACREPTANIPEMRRFVEIYKKYSRGNLFFLINITTGWKFSIYRSCVNLQELELSPNESINCV